MKKLTAAIIAICMVLILVSCGESADVNEEKDGTGYQNTEMADTETTDDSKRNDTGPAVPGYFDAEYDYASGESYKVGYLSMQNDFLTMEFDTAFGMWAPRLNIDYTNLWCPVSGSIDEFLSGITTYADQGYDGLLLTPDSTVYNRVIEVCEENEMPFFPVLGQARDYTGDGRLLAPGSGYDASDLGKAGFEQLIKWKEETYPETKWDKVGFISITWSIAPEVHQRTNIHEQMWAEMFPEFGTYDEQMSVNPKHFFIADAASGNADQTTCQNLVTQIISSNSEYEVWLIAAAVDYYAMGANAAIENLGIVDSSCVIAIGGGALREQFDNGIENAWRYAYCGPAGPFTEVPINALYAFMAGYATQETIYSEWVDPNDKGDIFDENGKLVEEHNYAKVLLKSTWIDIDNYKEYHEWSDYYSFGEGDGLFNYDVTVTDRDLYSAYEPIPDWGE